MDIGVVELVTAMHELRERFEAGSVRVGIPVQDGHTVFVEVTSAGTLSLEREDGHALMVSGLEEAAG